MARGFLMKVPPALVLFFLSPAIAELLLGSSPPSEFFSPFSLLLLCSLYGSGALIVRELKIRWNKGFVSMFVLGAAYGIIEEGLMVKSFFDPGWMDIGVLGVYGRWLGVNWVWAEWLTIYHAIFSIAIPITLVELAYPEIKGNSWLSARKFLGVTILFGAVVIFGFFFLTAYRPPLPQYLSSAVIMSALTFLAWKIPLETGKNGRLKPWGPRRLLLLGFLTATALFLLFMAGPYIISQPIVLMATGCALVLAIFGLIKRFDWNERTLYHKFSMVAGALAFLIMLAPLQELDRSRPDDTRGMLIVGIIALLMLFCLRKRLRAYITSEEASLVQDMDAVKAWQLQSLVPCDLAYLVESPSVPLRRRQFLSRTGHKLLPMNPRGQTVQDQVIAL